MFRNLLVIFDQSTMTLGNRLTKQFPVSEEEIVSAFVSLTDKDRQHSLMVMPSDEARMRLEFLAQIKPCTNTGTKTAGKIRGLRP